MEHKKIYPWIVVALLWFVALLNYMDRQMLSVMRESMMIDIVALERAANFGRLMSIFLWIYGMMSPFMGSIADRVNRKWLIVCSLFIWSAVTLLMGLCTTFDQLYVLRAIMGASEAAYIPAALALIADYHKDKTRSLAIGIHMTGLYVGQAMGGFGVTIAATFSWQHTFFSLGFIGILYSIILIYVLKEKRIVLAADNNTKRSLKDEIISVFLGLKLLLVNISFWIILLYFATPSLPGWATKNWLPTLFADSLHISMEQAGPLSTIAMAVASFVGVILGGILSDRWVLKNMRGRIYTGAIGLSLMIPALLLLGFGNTLLEIVSGAIFFGVGFGIFDANNMPILCQFVAPRYRATGYGLMNMTGVLAGAFITGYLGQSTDTGHLGNHIGLLSVGIVVVLILQLAYLRPTTIDKN
ncbi:MFS transporter [Sphingobacterium sp. SYP-B4668]|uniref:MFS transporter n=1 Tax=Sphingobacterium sp. SYP-B4668 TaxID=2996035 RepID=UPI0022DD4071|nr:MFS transporter [Sphingobacterium sp. SYP-B4668]